MHTEWGRWERRIERSYGPLIFGLALKRQRLYTLTYCSTGEKQVSHASVIETNIKFVEDSLLQDSLELMKRAEPELTFNQAFKTYSMQDSPCDVAIHSPKMKRGIGINFRDKSKGLEFIGDGFGYEKEYTRVQQLLLSTYHTLAVQRALVSSGYGTTITSAGVNRNAVEAIRA